MLILLLGAVFLAGFHEAIGIAVVIVGVFLAMNLLVVGGALVRIATAPQLVVDWGAALTQQNGNPLVIVGIALLVFPKLALGLSGFETGVTVMPLIKGREGDTEDSPEGRIAGARRLLTTAALIMSGFLDHLELRVHRAHPAARVRPRTAPRTDARWPTSPTSSSATSSAPPTTSRRSSSCGSRAPRRWRGCSTSCPATCRATAWPRTGPERSDRWSSCSPSSAS